MHLSRVFGIAVGPAVENSSGFGNGRENHVYVGKEFTLVVGAGEAHSVDQDGAAAASCDGHGSFALEVEIGGKFLPEGFGAVLGESQDVGAGRRPVVLCLVAGPALFVAGLFGAGEHFQLLLDGLLDLFVGQVVVQEDASLVDEQVPEIGVFQELLEHVADGGIAAHAKAHAAADAALARGGLVAAIVIFGGATQYPLEHVLAFGVEAHDARGKAVTVVHVEDHELEGVSVLRAAPGANVVVGPVAVVDVHFGDHVLGETVDVQLFLELGVRLVVLAGEVAAGNGIYHLAEFGAGGPVGTAGGPSVDAALVAIGAVLDHVDALGIDTVVGFDKASVQAFAQVVNAEVFAVVEHHYLEATLVIHVGAFHQAHQHGVAKVVGPETVAVVAQVEALHLLGFGAGLEERILENLVAVVVVVHLDGDALLGLVAAVVTDNRDACVDFPGLFGGRASVFEVFHVYGEFVVSPEVCLLAGFCTFGVVGVIATDSAPVAHARIIGQVARGVQTVGRVEHVVVIHGKGHHGHRHVFADKVGLGGGIGRLAVHEFRAADNGVLGNLLGLRKLFGGLSGEGAVEGATDFATLLRSRRFNGQAGIETGLRQEGFLGLVVVFVFLQATGRQVENVSRRRTLGRRVQIGVLGVGAVVCRRRCRRGTALVGDVYRNRVDLAGVGIGHLDARDCLAGFGIHVRNGRFGFSRFRVYVFTRIRVDIGGFWL